MMSMVLRIMGWIENMILFILMGSLFYLSIPIVGAKNIYLDPDTVDGIISQLGQKGYDVGILDAKLLAMIAQPISGWVYMDRDVMDRVTFLYRLTSRRAHYIVSTLIPGETIYYYVRQLSDELNIGTDRLHRHMIG